MTKVEKLLADYRKLSLVECGEFLAALGVPPPRIKRILGDETGDLTEQPDQSRNEYPDEEIGNEFLLYHTRPEWLDSSEPIPQGQHYYVLEFLYDDVITIRLRYDRARLIEHLRDIFIVGNFLEWYKMHSGQAAEFPCKITTQAKFERGLDFDCLKGVNLFRWYIGSESEYLESIRDAAEIIKKTNETNDWWPAHYRLMTERATEAEATFCSMALYKLDDTLLRFFKDIGKLVSREDGIVTADEYEEIARDRVILVRKAGAGGDRKSKYKLIKEDIHKLGVFYKLYGQVFSKVKSFYTANRKCKAWREMIKLEFSEYDLPDDLIEKLADPDNTKFAPSNLAIELAARRSIRGYQSFSLSADTLKNKLPQSPQTPPSDNVKGDHLESD